MKATAPKQLYDEDFFAWTQVQAHELRRFSRTRPNLPLDLGHIAEEIADLGKEQRNALRSWTVRIIEHLLLLEHSPAEEPRRRWIDEVVNFRSEIDRRSTPTLRRDLQRQRPRLYQEACRNLRSKLERYGEADVVARFSDACPYALDQILGNWWPEGESQERRSG